MFELIYPIDPAPLMPGVKADCAGMDEPDGEMVPVVDVSGLVVGRAARA